MVKAGAVLMAALAAVVLFPAAAPAAPPIPAHTDFTWKTPILSGAAGGPSFTQAVVEGPLGSLYAVGIVGGRDLRVLRFKSGRTLFWQSSSASKKARYVAADAAGDAEGNVVATCQTEAGSGRGDAVTIKYSWSGRLAWMRSWDGAAHGDDAAVAVAVTSGGQAYAAGHTTAAAGGTDALVLKYGAGGTLGWKYILSTSNDDAARDVALDASGNVYVTGVKGATGAATGQAFLLKLTANGKKAWERQADETATSAQGEHVVVRAGAVFVAGPETTASGTGEFGAKFSPSGDPLWTAHKSFTGLTTVRDMAVDSDGHMVIVGTDTPAGPAVPPTFGTIVKLGNGGAELWSNEFSGFWNGPYSAEFQTVITDGRGRVYVGGTLGASLTDAGRQKALVVMYQPTGSGAENWPDKYWAYDAGAGTSDISSLLVLPGPLVFAGGSSRQTQMLADRL